MIKHRDITDQALKEKLHHRDILFAGNRALKIYGQLGCRSGKRMKRDKRVFFVSENEALQEGYRPCGHCMRKKYNQWISSTL